MCVCVYVLLVENIPKDWPIGHMWQDKLCVRVCITKLSVKKLTSWFPLLGIMEPYFLAKSVDGEVLSCHKKTVLDSMMNVQSIYLPISPKVSLTLVVFTALLYPFLPLC